MTKSGLELKRRKISMSTDLKSGPQSKTQLEHVKLTLLKAVWVSQKGNRRNAAAILGIGYTNAVETLRAAGVKNRKPDAIQAAESVAELKSLRASISELIDSIVDTP